MRLFSSRNLQDFLLSDIPDAWGIHELNTSLYPMLPGLTVVHQHLVCSTPRFPLP